MPSPLLASSRRCTSLPLTKSCSLPSSTLRKPLIVLQGRSCGGPWGAWVWINWLCMSSRACTPMPGAVCWLLVNTVKSLGLGVVVHQGSILSLLHFIFVLEALSHKFRISVPWELLYADDHMVIANTHEEYISKLKVWKAVMESKGLRVNMKKNNLMVSGVGLDVQIKSDKSSVLSAAKVSATTLLDAHNVSYGSTRSSTASLVDRWRLYQPQV